MFRKAIILFLVFIYSLSFSGLSLEIHSCMGRISSIQTFQAKKCPCGSLKNKSCCKTQVIKFSLKEALSKNPGPKILSQGFELPVVFTLTKEFHPLSVPTLDFNSKEGPPNPTQSLYIQFRNFRV